MNGISVIVCCYNSASRIPETLKHLYLQQINLDLKWEIIVVNNASTDRTKEIVNDFKSRNTSSVSLRLVEEPVPGLTNARKKGMEVAEHDLVIFCDDDNHLDTHYIIKAHQLMNTFPAIGIAGGWVKPKLSFYPGKWIEDFYGALAIGKQAPQAGQVRWVFGAGMVLRKKVLTDLQERKIKFLLSDRVGTQQTSGGDAEICLLANYIGYEVYYSSELILDHCISFNRLNKKAFLKTSHQNFYPVMHLFLLDQIVFDGSKSVTSLFTSLFIQRVGRIINAIPRCVWGRHQFHSFISLYSNGLFVMWLFFNIRKFGNAFSQIKLNLLSV